MKIHKLGHCCLRIEVGSLVILTDPGNFTTGYEGVGQVDIVLITHEHADHVHVPALRMVLEHNRAATVITNTSVANLLAREGITATVLEGEAEMEVGPISLKAHDGKHEEIYEALGQVQNTGYFIAGQLFYPGDAFAVPAYSVPVLALPVAGPWCAIGAAIRYALTVKPKVAFPVHDGMIEADKIGAFHRAPALVLGEHDIDFKPLLPGESLEA